MRVYNSFTIDISVIINILSCILLMFAPNDDENQSIIILTLMGYEIL